LVFVGFIGYVLFVAWGSYFSFSLQGSTPSASDCARLLSAIKQLPLHSPLLRETVDQAGQSHAVHGMLMVVKELPCVYRVQSGLSYNAGRFVTTCFSSWLDQQHAASARVRAPI
jgi:hypothetical protein